MQHADPHSRAASTLTVGTTAGGRLKVLKFKASKAILDGESDVLKASARLFTRLDAALSAD